MVFYYSFILVDKIRYSRISLYYVSYLVVIVGYIKPLGFHYLAILWLKKNWSFENSLVYLSSRFRCCANICFHNNPQLFIFFPPSVLTAECIFIILQLVINSIIILNMEIILLGRVIVDRGWFCLVSFSWSLCLVSFFWSHFFSLYTFIEQC